MGTALANVQMAAAWDGDEGEDWARDWERYDRAVRLHHQALLDAAAVGTAERVLDVGCGNGQSTRDAARAAAQGSALGVDLSSRMIARARELALAEGLGNAHFEQADAQVHTFDTAAYDVAVSRFGGMFFADPVAAFTNIGTAIRPGGRLVMVAWRPLADNEWLQCFFAALALGRDLPAPPPGAPGPFGLADPLANEAALAGAGFEAIEHTPVDAPVWLGADAEDAFAYFRTTGIVRGMTKDLDDAQRAQALDGLRAAMVAHDSGDGVRFGSGAWLITARRPSR
jgi:SAM-dependent methyltransferase